MKNYVKTALCVAVFLGGMAASVLFAQEVNEEPAEQKDVLHWSVGLSAEGNMNVPKGYALGAGLYGLVVLPDWVKTGRFSAGAKSSCIRRNLKDTDFLIRLFYSAGIFMILQSLKPAIRAFLFRRKEAFP